MSGVYRCRGKQFRGLNKKLCEATVESPLPKKHGVIKTENCLTGEKFKQEMNKKKRRRNIGRKIYGQFVRDVYAKTNTEGRGLWMKRETETLLCAA